MLFPPYIQAPAAAPSPTPTILARYVKLLAQYSGSPDQVACADPAVGSELQVIGVNLDAKSRVAWAATEEEVHAYAKDHRLIICAHREWLALGAAIAIASPTGKPELFFHAEHMRESHLHFDDRMTRIMVNIQ